MRTAIRLYETGAVPTMKKASEAAGLHPATFTINRRRVPEQVNREMERVRDKLDDKTVSLSAIVEAMGRRALYAIEEIMDQGEEESVRLRAAIDLADRAPATAKTQKHQVMSLTIDGKDAKDIAEALVKSAEVRASFGTVAEGDYVKVAQPTLPSDA